MSKHDAADLLARELTERDLQRRFDRAVRAGDEEWGVIAEALALKRRQRAEASDNAAGHSDARP